MKSTILVTIVSGKITSVLSNGDAVLHVELEDGVHEVTPKVITNAEMEIHLRSLKQKTETLPKMTAAQHNAFPKGRFHVN
jgi:hypothetical protein